MSDNRPIGFFDSGVGGLSIIREVTKVLPYESTLFFADQANMPYGAKDKKTIQSLTVNAVKFLVSNNAKAVVVACNTATCYAIGHIRSRFKVPIIGVVPAVKTASKLTKKGNIAVLSTPATAKSNYLDGLIKKFAPDSTVSKISCTGLEQAIEKNDTKKIDNLLEKYTRKIINLNADVSVLGCTHYPLVKNQIENKLPKNYLVIDSSNPIAKQVKRVLIKNNMLSSKKYVSKFFTSADNIEFSQVASYYLNAKVRAQQTR